MQTRLPALANRPKQPTIAQFLTDKTSQLDLVPCHGAGMEMSAMRLLIHSKVLQQMFTNLETAVKPPMLMGRCSGRGILLRLMAGGVQRR